MVEQLLSEITDFTVPDIDQKEVDRAQQKLLGPFWKQGAIPAGVSNTDVALHLLNIDNYPEPSTSDARRRTLSQIIKFNLTHTRKKRIVVMIGASGCGKTASIMRLAKTNYVIYMRCDYSFLYADKDDVTDSDYLEMADQITSRAKKIDARYPEVKTRDQTLCHDEDLKLMATAQVKKEVLARLLFLLLHLRQPNMTPESFIRWQLSGGTQIREFLGRLWMRRKMLTRF